MRTTPLLIAAVAATALAGAGFAFGAASSSSTIHACANRHTGALRLAAKCKHSERAVSWSVTGPRGATGAPGHDGTNGTNGTNGIDGINGTPATTVAVRAFARIGGESSLTPNVESNHGFQAITSPSNGIYCLTPAASTGIAPATDAAVVSASYNSALVPDELFAQLDSSSGCPAGSFGVRAAVTNGTTSAEVANPNVEFSIVVP